MKKIFLPILLLGLAIIIAGCSLTGNPTPTNQSYNLNTNTTPETNQNTNVNADKKSAATCVTNSDCYPAGFKPQVCGTFYTCSGGQCYEGSAACPPPPAATAVSVVIENFAFNPSEITVKKGGTVTWTNNDSAPHQIKSATFNSGPLSSGQNFSFTFNEAGSFDYSCAIHPSMTGKVIVVK